MASDLGEYVWFYYDLIIVYLAAITVTKWLQHSKNQGIMVFSTLWCY